MACKGMFAVTLATLLLTIITEQLLSYFVMTIDLKWSECVCGIPAFEWGCSLQYLCKICIIKKYHLKFCRNVSISGACTIQEQYTEGWENFE